MGFPIKLHCSQLVGEGHVQGIQQLLKKHTLLLFNIAMENGPFIDGLPIKNGDFPWLC